MEENLPQGFAAFAFPREHQRRLRTSNPLERVNKELKRRTCGFRFCRTPVLIPVGQHSNPVGQFSERSDARDDS
jgi:hypothetical protein